MSEVSRAERIDRIRHLMTEPSRLRGGVFEPVFSSDGQTLFLLDGADRSAVHRVDVETGKREPAVDSDELRAALERDHALVTDQDVVPCDRIRLADDDTLRMRIRGRWFDVGLGADPRPVDVSAQVGRAADPGRFIWPAPARSIRTEGVTGLVAHAGVGSPLASPDGRWVLEATGGSLAVRSTFDGRRQVVASAAGAVAYTTAGAAWSPDGLRVAVLRISTEGMAQLPIVHWLKPVEEVEYVPYVKSGGRTAGVRVEIVDITSGQVVAVDIPDEDGLRLHVCGWGRDLHVLTLNRRGDRLRLYGVDPSSGHAEVLIEEDHQDFFEGLSVGWHLPGFECTVEDGRRILWTSERDGWRHLYLYDREGNLERRLTSGQREVSHVVAVDEHAQQVLYAVRSDPARPMDVQVHRIGLDGQGDAPVTSGPGQHALVVAPSGTVLLDRHSSIDQPDRVVLLRPDGSEVAVLSQAEGELDWCEPEEFTALAADGETVLHGLLYHPPNFDPSKAYPLVEHIYAGPYRSNVGRTHTDGKHVLAQVVADAGFVVAVFDGRGTPERGAEFQGVVTRRFGQHEILDHGGVVEQLLAERSYLDPQRVGIFGGSWGGYFTIRALLTRPDLYKVGVSLYPAIDLYDHAALAIEQYMKLPVDNPDGYREADNKLLVERLEGKLLLVHGTSDVNATFSTTMKMVEALTRASKPYDLIVMPEQAHDLSGHTGLYAVAATVDYFVEHLGGGDQ